LPPRNGMARKTKKTKGPARLAALISRFCFVSAQYLLFDCRLCRIDIKRIHTLSGRGRTKSTTRHFIAIVVSVP
jgi:hypothetical protein